ncbi:recombinase family protein [Chryseomicrobium sp. FSL W7-1435]|uniref:recombinase family protein n=1 Tax=Chryseomicrobium sp. FSL W7-1435 TaxID=2921704 RepID=UPI00315A277D
MKYGYIRTIPGEQDTSHQFTLLSTIELDQLFTEQSYRLNDQLAEMIDLLKEGDHVYTSSLTTFAQSLNQLRALLETFTKKKVSLHFVSENIQIDKPLSQSFSELIHVLALFQSESTSLMTKVAMEEAKERGVTTGRPRKKDANVNRAIELYTSGDYTLKQIKEITNISKSTLYRYLNEDY